MRHVVDQGPICICGPVFSELLGLPGRNPEKLEAVLTASGIAIEWDVGEDIWRHAGLAYQGYGKRRKKSGGGMPRRLLTHLLIGAHTSVRGYQLLTLDLDNYRAAFPDLMILRA